MTTTELARSRAHRGRALKNLPVRIKVVSDGDPDSAEAGTVEAIVSAFGNVDSYGDRMIKGAFTDTLADWRDSGDPIPFIFSHDWQNPLAHVGVVTDAEERDEGLWVRAQIDRDTEFSRKVYGLLKGRRVREFSFAFDYVDASETDETDEHGLPIWDVRAVKLYECGPCLVGANPATELLDVKSETAVKGAIPPHSTATDDGTWDGGKNEANLSNDEGESVYRQAYAWVDGDADPDTKAAYRFVHHFVSADGKVGAASTVACSTGIGVLNGGRGGTTIPSGDRQGVYDHLAKHLRDADMEPPDLKSRPGKMGRTISKATADEISAAIDAIDTAADKLRALLDLGSSDSDDGDDGSGQPAQSPDDETDGKSSAGATRGPAAWMTAFEAAGTTEDSRP
jgi:uncharacterized protein